MIEHGGVWWERNADGTIFKWDGKEWQAWSPSEPGPKPPDPWPMETESPTSPPPPIQPIQVAAQPKRGRGCLITLAVIGGAVLLLGILGAVCGLAVFQNADEIAEVVDEAEDVVDDPGSAPESGSAVGEPASDGKFTFTITDFQCGTKKIGSGPFSARAQGEYCIAELTVENTGDESQLMDSSSQYLYIGGKEYSADSDALLALKKAQNFFLEEINPGLSVKGVILWDVPPGSRPSHLELHDSPFSGGVIVKL